MKKEIVIEVPNDWSAITLRKYLEMYKDLKAYEGESDAVMATLFYHLCGVTPQIMHKLDTDTFVQIRNQLNEFVGNTNVPLVRSFVHNGIEYGFHPNLSKIEYGAYVDICKYTAGESAISEDWAKVMAILYRPITKSAGKLYEVKGYDTEAEWEWFMEIGMDVHLGAWFFFINLSMDLLSATLNSSVMTEALPPNIVQTLQESGEAIHQLLR